MEEGGLGRVCVCVGGGGGGVLRCDAMEVGEGGGWEGWTRGRFKPPGGGGWTMVVLERGVGVSEGVKLVRPRTTLNTMKLSPQNSFGE